MKKIIPLLSTIILTLLISCNPFKDISLNSITELYGGQISIAKGVRASTSDGKINYLRLTFEQNKFVASGWLIPDAMARNCAILFLESNPETFDKVDVLEIEIIHTTSSLFEYRKEDLDDSELAYKKAEGTLESFVNTLYANKMDEALRFMKSGPKTDMTEMETFLKTVKNVLPANYKSTKIIGYRVKDQAEKTFEIDFVVISLDNVKRMMKATMVEDGNGMKIYSITI